MKILQYEAGGKFDINTRFKLDKGAWQLEPSEE